MMLPSACQSGSNAPRRRFAGSTLNHCPAAICALTSTFFVRRACQIAQAFIDYRKSLSIYNHSFTHPTPSPSTSAANFEESLNHLATRAQSIAGQWPGGSKPNWKHSGVSQWLAEKPPASVPSANGFGQRQVADADAAPYTPIRRRTLFRLHEAPACAMANRETSGHVPERGNCYSFWGARKLF